MIEKSFLEELTGCPLLMAGDVYFIYDNSKRLDCDTYYTMPIAFLNFIDDGLSLTHSGTKYFFDFNDINWLDAFNEIWDKIKDKHKL